MTKAKAPAKQPAAAAKRKSEASTPWEQDNPKSAGEHKPLSAQAKAAAKRRAKAAGRPYPNLVDNMQAAKAANKK
jgi:hypothetical protein